MYYADDLQTLRQRIDGSEDLRALRGRLIERAEPLLVRPPAVPGLKALLSTDGGICPHDGTPLRFDPWSPSAHVCPRCGQTVSGERHDRHWARSQHLWLVERAAHLATAGVVGGDARCIAGARDLLLAYPQVYFDLPNRDNVLGPSRLFFSTYLESMWLLNYLAAAMLLREGGALSEGDVDRLSTVAEEASALIGEFNEGMSNRQTWHAAALTAIAVWFEDEDLARNAVEGRTGLLGHLTDGFGDDGLWYEGENYHLFALRGLLTGIEWGRAAGADLTADPALADILARALLAPARTALPDLTYPARKDARYGASLAQPVHLELWEAGRAWLPAHRGPLDAWLAALYAEPVIPQPPNDSWLHEAGEEVPARRTRADLSWWALCTMSPALETPESPWEPSSELFPTSGLAVLRSGDRYVSLECGGQVGGHGHPDCLHLTLHAGGTHWLPDPGAGSYVSRDLFWYRSTLAHNAPRLDGRDQAPDDSWCGAFAEEGRFGWTRGRWGDVGRSVVTGPSWVADLVSLEGTGETPRRLEVPWHLQGTVTIVTPGRWTPADLNHELVEGAEEFAADADGPVILEAIDGQGRRARLFLLLEGGTLLRATGPGVPGTGTQPFWLVRSPAAPVARQGAALDLDPTGAEALTGVRLEGNQVTLTHASGAETTLRFTEERVEVRAADAEVALAGTLPAPKRRSLLFTGQRSRDVLGDAWQVEEPPALDGTLEGFVLDAPLELGGEHQYRRSEDPYEGPDQFRATAWINWDLEALYVAVEVDKPEVVFRGDGAPPLRLDNEPDDIHSDGVQVYLRVGETAEIGLLVVPTDDGRLRARATSGARGGPELVTGAWQLLEEDDPGRMGYRLTFRIDCPALADLPPGASVDFDLLVNEMRSDRQRRAGQLVWSGKDGWVYLRGDRHLPTEFGELALR